MEKIGRYITMYINKYLTTFIYLFLSFSTLSIGQNISFDKIEQEMRKYINEGEEIKKQVVDLNNDGKGDLIYSCACGEMLCIRVYLQKNGQYIKVIDTARSTYALIANGKEKNLQLTESSCCGESPFTLYQTYHFSQTSALFIENYIITNKEYTDGKILTPPSFLEKPYFVKTLNDNYNLRFSPDMLSFEGSNEENFVFTCQPLTNIIATIKLGSCLKVLSELQVGGRTWLYVEAKETAIKNKCYITDFDSISSFRDHQHPSIRGWVSNRYVEKE